MWLALLKNWKYAAFLAAFLAGWYINGLRHEINASELAKMVVNQERKLAEEVLAAHLAAVEKLEKERDNALKNHRAAVIETRRLATALADGNLRLRVSAVCEPSATSGTEPAEARLAPDAERAYFAHRDAIDDVNKLLDLCGVPASDS